MLYVFLFLALGILFGIIMGLIPGIHPNMVVLAVPLFASLNIEILPLLAFVVALGVTNSMVDFIPSILLGAPEGGNELSTLPGHRMLLRGHGYDAVKLAVIGGVGAVVVVVLLLPLVIFAIPALYSFLRPAIAILLLSIILLMILTEKGRKKFTATFVFLLAGSLGLIMNTLPLDNTLLLFPVFSGFFGISLLFLQIREKTKIPRQKESTGYVSTKTINRSILSGSLSGIAAGFLPGVGSSEIATLSTIDKNDKSFLITIGALTTANIILSILSLWLIGRPRSGLAVAVDSLFKIGLSEVLFVVAAALATAGIAAVATLFLAKRFIAILERINYSAISKIVIIFIILVAAIFTGFFGLALLGVTTALGVFTNLAGVKRGNLMGVLILPTLLFYAGI